MTPALLRIWPKELVVERGGTARLGELVSRLGTRALLICGHTVAHGEIMERLRAGLGAHLVATFDGVMAHTPRETVLAAAELLRSARADVIVSAGGGSATDPGKAVAFLAATGTLDAGLALPVTTLPHIAVPTVPGAGSIILPTAGVLDPQSRTKLLFDDPRLVPEIGLLDAELLVRCGPELSAITIVRAIVASIEALYARRRNAFTNALALDAIRLMRIALPAALSTPDDIDARELSLYAAILGTLASANCGVSAVHAAGLILGARYNLAHGIAHTILLPPAMRSFLPELEGCMAGLAESLGSSPGQAAIREFERLAAEAGLPMRLGAIGVPQEDLAEIAAQTAVLPMMQNAPRSVPIEEIRSWLEAVY